MKKLVKMVLSSAFFVLMAAASYAEEFKAQMMFNGSSSLAPVFQKFQLILLKDMLLGIK